MGETYRRQGFRTGELRTPVLRAAFLGRMLKAPLPPGGGAVSHPQRGLAQELKKKQNQQQQQIKSRQLEVSSVKRWGERLGLIKQFHLT